MSLSLRLQGAKFCFRDERPLLDGVDLHLTEGWTGLVGDNGAGKSTLLRILASDLAPGLVIADPPDVRVIRLEQRVDEPDDDVRALSQAWDADAVRLQSRLGLGLDDLDRWTTLSPGERRRWQIGAALWRQPQVLLLDEPDNHLDGNARDLMVEALRLHCGIGVVVSHDQRLLDTLTSRTLRLQRGKLDLVEGSVSQALQVWQAEAVRRREQLQAHSRAARRAEAGLHAARQRASATSAARSMRHVDRRDHDARSMARKSRLAVAERQHARSLSRARHSAELAQHSLAAAERPSDLGRRIELNHQAPRRRRLAQLTREALHIGNRVLLRDLSLLVEREDRIWISGPNGAGKSTLQRALLASCSLPDERVLHLPQELTEDQVDGLLHALHGLPSDARGRVLQLVAALGTAPDALLATERPSPGEARKLALALGLGTQAWLVALDEPDNHLDLHTRLRVQQALSGFAGAILLITHDQALARAVCTTRWHLEDQRVHVSTISR